MMVKKGGTPDYIYKPSKSRMVKKEILSNHLEESE